MLYVLAFALGIGETLHDTAAQSILPNVVAPERLSWANSRLYAVELTANQFVGPPIGGLLAAAALAGALSASALGYALAALALVLLVGQFRPAARVRRIRPCGPTSPKACATWRATGCCARSPSASASPTWHRRPCSPSSRSTPSSPVRWGCRRRASGCCSRHWPPARSSAPSSSRRSNGISAAARTLLLAARDVPALRARRGGHGQRRGHRPRLLRRHGAHVQLERHHRLAASADRARPAARPGQRRLPAPRLGHDAARRRARRNHRPALRRHHRVLDVCRPQRHLPAAGLQLPARDRDGRTPSADEPQPAPA